VLDHRAAGLPYLVHLRHPRTGGVYASWGSLGHVTVAEPNALVGFLGAKVFEALDGRPFPPGVQRAENLADKGVVDAVVTTEDLPALVDLTLAVLADHRNHPLCRCEATVVVRRCAGCGRRSVGPGAPSGSAYATSCATARTGPSR
jgi:acetyl-CoA carboxylase carboxyl transferase subunit beta